MSGFAKDFEELEIYKRSKEIVLIVYEISKNEKFKKDFALTNQIRKAAISVISNIAEGFDRGSKKEFILFLNYAKGSNGEIRAQLDIAHGVGYITEEKYLSLKNKLIANGKMISIFVKKMKKQING